MCGFGVGDEVVCVDAEPVVTAGALTEAALIKGAIYTVIAISPVDEDGDGPRVHLAEITNGPPWCGYPDEGLYPWRFRKVERKSDSLSIEGFRTIKDGGFEEPKRTNQPAKRKEQA